LVWGLKTPELLTACKVRFAGSPQQRALSNAVRKNGIGAVAMDLRHAQTMQHTFAHVIKGGPITNQKQSGRCWINGYHNRLKRWILPFNGVSTKYLPNYLVWFQRIDALTNIPRNVIATRLLDHSYTPMVFTTTKQLLGA
jgi:aminopeptidase C